MDQSLLLNEILPNVEKPIRYLGNELNSIHKDWSVCKEKFAFVFPDIYEIGMSHLGMQILYEIVNDIQDFLMERVFSPWVDFEAELRNHQLPIYSLESFHPIIDFDIVGFTLQYELSYTNILNILELGNIPLLCEDRDESMPIIVAGGPCAFNPEPLVDFIDLFMLGDGEEVLPNLLRLHLEQKSSGKSKDDFLLAATALPGIYVPKYYDVKYLENGYIASITPNNKFVPNKIQKVIIKDINKFILRKPIVPFMDIVHDRIMLEILRGCTHGCRFCQAGILYRPVRERKLDNLLDAAELLVANTGHDDISLTSLSSADYSSIRELSTNLIEKYKTCGVSVSLPSLRVDTFSVEVAQEIQKVRKTGLTFAPEAGTQRMRDIINKGVTENDLIKTLEGAYRSGWTTIKLYFMIGLPYETDEDILGITELAQKMIWLGKRILKEEGIKKPLKLTVSVASFVPKTHTAFQWFAQNTREELHRKQMLLKDAFKTMKNVVYNYHDVNTSFLEAVFAKGDRKLGKVLLEAHQRGCKFDSWRDYFSMEKWMQSFAKCGIDASWYAYRELDYKDILPWDHLTSGVFTEFLSNENEKAKICALTADCREAGCVGCGACNNLESRMIINNREINYV
ncbi:MAG: TIGR03960 family B12-binding radical SAM protein [Clostridia bacterium]